MEASFNDNKFQNKNDKPNEKANDLKSGISNISTKLTQKLEDKKPMKATSELVDEYTSKVPSLGFMGLAVGAMAASAALNSFTTRKNLANFVGLWAPSFLLLALYNKVTKIEHELEAHAAQE